MYTQRVMKIVATLPCDISHFSSYWYFVCQCYQYIVTTKYYGILWPCYCLMYHIIIFLIQIPCNHHFYVIHLITIFLLYFWNIENSTRISRFLKDCSYISAVYFAVWRLMYMDSWRFKVAWSRCLFSWGTDKRKYRVNFVWIQRDSSINRSAFFWTESRRISVLGGAFLYMWKQYSKEIPSWELKDVLINAA